MESVLNLSEMLSSDEIKKVSDMKCGVFNNVSYWGYKSSVLHLWTFKTPIIYKKLKNNINTNCNLN